MPNKVERFFICLLALFFSVKCPVKSFAYFSFGLPAFFLLVCRYSSFFLKKIFIWLHLVLFGHGVSLHGCSSKAQLLLLTLEEGYLLTAGPPDLECGHWPWTSLCQQRSIWSRLWFFQWSCMDVRVGLWRKLSAEKLMLLNCGVGEDSWESLRLQGDPTSPS